MDLGKVLVVGVFVIIAGVAASFSDKFFLLGSYWGIFTDPGGKRSFIFQLFCL